MLDNVAWFQNTWLNFDFDNEIPTVRGDKLMSGLSMLGRGTANNAGFEKTTLYEMMKG